MSCIFCSGEDEYTSSNIGGFNEVVLKIHPKHKLMNIELHSEQDYHQKENHIENSIKVEYCLLCGEKL